MKFGALKDSVFHAKEKPELLAQLLHALSYPIEITEDFTMPDVPVRLGVALNTVKATLPTKMTVHIGYFTEEITVTWGATTDPSFNANVAGTYTLAGTISGLPKYIANTATKTVLLNLVSVASDDALITSISLGTASPVVCNTFVPSAVAGEFTGIVSIPSAKAAIGQAFAIVTHDTPATVSTTGLATGAVTTKTGVIANAPIANGGKVVVTITAEDGTTITVYTITVTVV